MKLKKGDKFIVPMLEICCDPDERDGYVEFLVNGLPLSVHEDLFKRHSRKVLGLLGDEGLEAQVGMKVWEAVFGEGEIVAVEVYDRFTVRSTVRFKQALNRDYNYQGKPLVYDLVANRALYVTDVPEEPKGFAWVKSEKGFPYTHCRITKKEAKEVYGDSLINWIPESECE